MGLSLFIAFRLVRSRRSPTLSLVTLISISGIACGVLALTVVLSVTQGFEATFQERILGLFPHMVVTANRSQFEDYHPTLEAIRAADGVVEATPLTTQPMMAANGVHRSGVTLQGVELGSVAKVINVESIIQSGSLAGLSERPQIRREGTKLVLDGVVAGTSMTLLITDDADPQVLFEGTIVPDAGRARVKILDLRTRGRAPPHLAPRDGSAAELQDLLTTVGFPPRGPAAFSAEVELAAGTWELDLTGQALEVEEGTRTTMVLLDGADGAPPETWLMVEPAGDELREGMARVRTVDTRASGPTLGIAVAGADRPALASEPDHFTGFHELPGRWPGILVGRALADRLKADLDTTITVVTPLRGVDGKMLGPVGMLPSSQRFRVAGVFESGYHDHDAQIALINLRTSHRFLNRGDVISSIAVRATSLDHVDETKRRIARAIDPIDFEDLVVHAEDLRDKLEVMVQPGFSLRRLAPSKTFLGGLRNAAEAVNLLKFQSNDYVSPARHQIFDWREKNRNIFNALQYQKVGLTMFFLIIIVVGSFVVVGSQIMVINEKKADIAILKTMGATGGAIRLVFTLQGLLVAVVGVVVGLTIGLGFVWLIQAVEYDLEASIYLIDHLPARIEPFSLVLVAIGTLICTVLTTQISAGRAAGQTPVAGLRALD